MRLRRAVQAQDIVHVFFHVDCPPLVLEEGAKKLDTGISRLYQRYLLQLMRSQHEKKRARYPALELPVADASLDTFWKFDDALTAPLHGFADARL